MECDRANKYRTVAYFFISATLLEGTCSLNYTQKWLPLKRLRPGLRGSGVLKGGQLPLASPLIQSMANIMFLAKNIHCGLVDKGYILDDSLEAGRFQ